jgi:hypothetical protein
MKKIIRETAEEILQEYTNCYSEADEDCLVEMLKKLASDVAREIFEEIDREIEMALKCNYKVKRDAEDDNEGLVPYIDGKIDCLRGLEGFIAELKKKYTEISKEITEEGK